MPLACFPILRARRRAILTAVAALAAAGALGEGALAGSDVARAAAVSIADLQGASLPSLSPLVDRVKSAVVSVKVNTVNEVSESEPSEGVTSEIQQFLRRFSDQDGASQDTIVGEGSGFFISSDGSIVTNNDVVRNAKSVVVTMMDGKTLDAEVVGSDANTDIALLKVRQPGDYPYVNLSKQAPKLGDWAVAIGKPNGLAARSPPASSRRTRATRARALTTASCKSTHRSTRTIWAGLPSTCKAKSLG